MNLNPEESHGRSSARRRILPVVLVLLVAACGIGYLRTRRTEAPLSIEARLQLAHSQLQENNVEAAEKLFEEVLKSAPDSLAAAEELRWIYFNTFRERDVEHLLDGQLAQFPERQATLYHAMMTEFRTQTPREVIGQLQEIEAGRPGQLPVVRALAYCHWHFGELEQARTEFERALAAAPDDPQTLMMLVEFSLELNQLTQAELLLQRIDLSGDDRPHWLRSLLAERLGKLELALEEVERAHELRPFELKYVYHSASLLRQLGQTDDAERAFALAQQIDTAERALSEVVLSGQIEQLTPQLCRRLAELSLARTHPIHAEAWNHLADRLERGEIP